MAWDLKVKLCDEFGWPPECSLLFYGTETLVDTCQLASVQKSGAVVNISWVKTGEPVYKLLDSATAPLSERTRYLQALPQLASLDPARAIETCLQQLRKDDDTRLIYESSAAALIRMAEGGNAEVLEQLLAMVREGIADPSFEAVRGTPRNGDEQPKSQLNTRFLNR